MRARVGSDGRRDPAVFCSPASGSCVPGSAEGHRAKPPPIGQRTRTSSLRRASSSPSRMPPSSSPRSGSKSPAITVSSVVAPPRSAALGPRRGEPIWASRYKTDRLRRDGSISSRPGAGRGHRGAGDHTDIIAHRPQTIAEAQRVLMLHEVYLSEAASPSPPPGARVVALRPDPVDGQAALERQFGLKTERGPAPGGPGRRAGRQPSQLFLWLCWPAFTCCSCVPPELARPPLRPASAARSRS